MDADEVLQARVPPPPPPPFTPSSAGPTEEGLQGSAAVRLHKTWTTPPRPRQL